MPKSMHSCLFLGRDSKNVTICNLEPWSDYEYGVAVLPGPQSKYNELEYAVSTSYITTGESGKYRVLVYIHLLVQ